MAVFLDHAATSPLRPEALSALNEALLQLGNPSSIHSHGQATREILEQARDQIANSVGCNRSEVVFCSGGTEANNQAVKGIWWSRHTSERKLIISSALEHKALLDPIEWLVEHEGAELIELPVTNGHVSLAALQKVLHERSEEVALISLMWVNNETGVITDMEAVTRIAEPYGVPVHSDAIAALGRIPVDFAKSGLYAMSISGHKVGAPIGIGALVVRRDAKPVNLIHGGGQERGLRSGTMNYSLASAFGAAAEVAVKEMSATQSRLQLLRDQIEEAITKAIPLALVTAKNSVRVEHNAHLIFPGVNNDALLFLLDQQGISVSAGSACQAGVLGPSHVLIGMGYSEADAASCVRVSLGYSTSQADVDRFIKGLIEAYPKALAASPMP
jgi:cysteine desulfurase